MFGVHWTSGFLYAVRLTIGHASFGWTEPIELLPSDMRRGWNKWCSKNLRNNDTAWYHCFKGHAGQKAPPGGNAHHTTCKTPQNVVSAFVTLVLHSFPPF